MTGRSPIRVALLAACCALAAGAGAARGSTPSLGPRVALAGSSLPAARAAHVLAAVAPSKATRAVVMLRPRNQALLQRLALHSSGRPGFGEARIRSLFAPTPTQVRAVRGYLAAAGLEVVSHTDMTMTVAGPAVAAERAFGVGLRIYRTAAGRTFQAPDGAIRLPAAIAAVVQAVGGLDDAVRLRPAGDGTAGAHPSVVTPTCAGATDAQHRFGGYLPDDLGQPAGYGHAALIAGGADGSGERIGMVEFSDYARSDVTHFRSCFPAITGTYAPDAVVGRPNPDASGRVEVALDLEVAMGAAPDASLRAYIAQNNPAFMPVVLDQMRHDGIDIISDSWGACEPLITAPLLQAENTALELVAVAGISAYVATGDFGSADCYPFVGSTNLFVDDPSSQPFATAVGGTTLHLSPVFPGHRETAWHGSGGGVSMWWPKPAYQVGRTIQVRGHKCRAGRAQCRETPDVALSARPKRTGYIMYCSRCGFGQAVAWTSVGGTSAAAPLMAGLTADADESAGKQLGFANPFLYAQAGTGVFHDIVSGKNSLLGSRRYQARPGFDMATGLGSVHAGAFAAALAAYAPGAVSVDATHLHVTGPANGRSTTYGQRVTFRGALTDTTTSQPIANAPIMVVTNVGGFRTRTDPAGNWSVSRSKAITQSLVWHVVFLGSDTAAPATTANRSLFVVPHLGLRIGLPFRHGHFVASRGKPFPVRGRSRPVMLGAIVELQERRGGGSWTTVGVSRVTGGGWYGSEAVRLTRPGPVSIRWAYTGGAFQRWLPARSRVRAVTVR